MAQLVLSDSRTLTMEPLRKNRWLMQFQKIPNAANVTNNELSFVALTSGVPELTLEAKEYHRLNERFYMNSKPSWNELPMTFYDFISGTNSAADILYKWMTLLYNPLTGAMAYKSQFTTTGTLAMLDPEGAPVRIWNLYQMWPTKVNWGEGLDATSDDPNIISVTFRYDFAIKQDDIDTNPRT